MNVPRCLALGSRRQPDALARYVPGHDGIVYFARADEDDHNSEFIKINADPLLAGIPEYAHRMFALWTNIGKLTFTDEAYATYLMESVTLCLDDREALHAIRELLSMLQAGLYGINGLLSSYEILDECFSNFVTYLMLMKLGGAGRFAYLNESIQQNENPAVFENFVRIRRLIDGMKQAEPSMIAECLAPLFIAAGQIDPEVTTLRLTCDERFEFLLLIAEKSLRDGIECNHLANHCIQLAEKAGYKFSQFKTVKSQPPKYPKGMETLLKDLSQRKLYFDSRAIMKSMEKDTDMSSPFSPRADPRSMLVSLLSPTPNHEHFLPHVTAFREESKWRLCVKGEHDLQSSWTRYTLSTILRKAIFTKETECPLNSIIINDEPACPPITDQKCRFRWMRRVFG